MLDRPAHADDYKRLAKLKREYRHLVAGGGALLKSTPVTDYNGLIELLLDLEWLKPEKSKDRKAICAAVGALVDDLVASRSR